MKSYMKLHGIRLAALACIFLLLYSAFASAAFIDRFRTPTNYNEPAKQIVKKFSWSGKTQLHEQAHDFRVANSHVVIISNGKKAYFRDLVVNSKKYKPYESVPLREGSNSVYSLK